MRLFIAAVVLSQLCLSNRVLAKSSPVCTSIAVGGAAVILSSFYIKNPTVRFALIAPYALTYIGLCAVDSAEAREVLAKPQNAYQNNANIRLLVDSMGGDATATFLQMKVDGKSDAEIMDFVEKARTEFEKAKERI